jgi:hypothetical protein
VLMVRYLSTPLKLGPIETRVAVACPQAYFHAKYWGNVFVTWVVANYIEFTTERSQVRSDAFTSDKELSDADMKRLKVTYSGETTKIISDPIDHKRQIPISIYSYREEPHTQSSGRLTRC